MRRIIAALAVALAVTFGLVAATTPAQASTVQLVCFAAGNTTDHAVATGTQDWTVQRFHLPNGETVDRAMSATVTPVDLYLATRAVQVDTCKQVLVPSLSR